MNLQTRENRLALVHNVGGVIFVVSFYGSLTWLFGARTATVMYGVGMMIYGIARILITIYDCVWNWVEDGGKDRTEVAEETNATTEVEALYVITLRGGHPALPVNAGTDAVEAYSHLQTFLGYDYRLAKILPPRGIRFVADEGDDNG